MVDVKFKQKFNKVLPLAKIKKMSAINEIGLVKKGHRLSIMPVNENEFSILLKAATR
jgi:predicted RNA-binding protein with PUA-like domain